MVWEGFHLFFTVIFMGSKYLTMLFLKHENKAIKVSKLK